MKTDEEIETHFKSLSPQPKFEVSNVDDSSIVSSRGRSRIKKNTTSESRNSGTDRSSPHDSGPSGTSRILKESKNVDGINNNSTVILKSLKTPTAVIGVVSQPKTSHPVPKKSGSGLKVQENGNLVQGIGMAPLLSMVPYSPKPIPNNSSTKALPMKSYINPTHVALVEKAVREHKIFYIGGVYPAIRAALRKRGWVEKHVSQTNPGYIRFVIGTHMTKDVDFKPSSDDTTENAYTQRVLTNYPPDFIWVIRRDNIPWAQIGRDQIINRFPRAFFTTKVGIAGCIQAIHWFSEPGVSDTFFPRCYRISLEEEKLAFMDDYRLTACVSILRWFCSTFERSQERGVYDSNSKISCLALDFAVRQINNYVRMRRHEDIDWLMPPAFLNQHWEVFLSQYYSIIHQKMKLSPNDSAESIKVKYETAKKTIQRLAPYWNQMSADGIMNIWICKPGARSRGKGIVLMNQLDKIMGLLNQTAAREANWVVQKYIEKPMLIYNTKFDMRQWFIVTDWAPLTVWFARESYVRFCTKPFSLEDFHESVHLCNNAVQCKYQNAQNRDPGLPYENMWDCYTFQAYLKTIGKLDFWENVIYPGMKQGIIGVLLSSQESADVKRNCFELYGADYMFTEDFRPWLIEINSCPCMAGSTSVTARMCAQCLEDTVKVTIDRKNDRNAETGMFELIYRQNPATLNVSQFNASELSLTGKKMSKDVDWPGIMTKYNSRKGLAVPRANQNQVSTITKASPNAPSLTFTDLIQKLNLQETSKILSPSPYESIPKTLQTSNTSALRIPSIVPVHLPQKTPGKEASSTGNEKSVEIENVLNVRKLPQSNIIAPSNSIDVSKFTDVAKYTINSIHNNRLTPKPTTGTHGTTVDLKKVDINANAAGNIPGKIGMIPLSYLMYNAKTNPVTITDIIREYSELTNKMNTMETMTKNFIEERNPIQAVSNSKLKYRRSKSVSSKTNSIYTMPISPKSKNRHMGINNERRSSPGTHEPQKLNVIQNMKDAEEGSRKLKRKAPSLRKTSPGKGEIKTDHRDRK